MYDERHERRMSFTFFFRSSLGAVFMRLKTRDMLKCTKYEYMLLSRTILHVELMRSCFSIRKWMLFRRGRWKCFLNKHTKQLFHCHSHISIFYNQPHIFPFLVCARQHSTMTTLPTLEHISHLKQLETNFWRILYWMKIFFVQYLCFHHHHLNRHHQQHHRELPLALCHIPQTELTCQCLFFLPLHSPSSDFDDDERLKVFRLFFFPWAFMRRNDGEDEMVSTQRAQAQKKKYGTRLSSTLSTQCVVSLMVCKYEKHNWVNFFSPLLLPSSATACSGYFFVGCCKTWECVLPWLRCWCCWVVWCLGGRV